MMKYLPIVAALALAGCGGWDKPGASLAEFDQDSHQCNVTSYQAAPVNMQTKAYSQGYRAPAQTNCTTWGNQTNCSTQPGTYTPPVQSTVDANAAAREGIFDSCMQSKGWRFRYQ